ncbi:MAG: YggS family pyridoxal phosphate-dependent enzyme [Candidatus Competibacteraceae bacterium]|nr:YggS family pyridoxal phosphate-dependent enzyme [Candidatus Competibacteraceae bacterium]MCB1810591.1 YggS family pyridoxal phosphate-dependent enzyme [Candidatus Competibacteraceae bacterium]
MPNVAPNLVENLARVQQRIRTAEQYYGRTPNAVHLLAVSKMHPAEMVAAAAAAGQTCFGENYLQEAEDKIQALSTAGLEWHFIGPIQSNKTHRIAELFDWVHSVDRLKIARRLNDQRPAERPPLNICLQVNISAEASKSGLTPDELPAVAAAVAQLPRLRLRGLMAIPAPTADFEQQRRSFQSVRQLQQQLQQTGLQLDTLSMGMSDDLEAAIAEGATWVRIGTAIFGPRQ